jgi:hypothetical protein
MQPALAAMSCIFGRGFEPSQSPLLVVLVFVPWAVFTAHSAGSITYFSAGYFTTEAGRHIKTPLVKTVDMYQQTLLQK